MSDLTKEQDAELGQEFYERLHRLTLKLGKRHEILPERAADFLLASALFVSASIQNMSIDETVELAATIAESVQRDELPPATRH